MKLPGNLFGGHRKHRKIHVPADRSLRTGVSSAVRTYYSIRGLKGFLEPRAAMIMRNNYETFMVPDAERMDKPQTIIATVYLKHMESFGQFTEIQQDYSLRSSALGEIALGHLADQISTDLARQISSSREKPRAVKETSSRTVPNKLAARRT
ncbi:MAG TPA: hypothetical protein VIB79_22255 [Candidatus Binatia bacterium]